ncbi:MAG: hypothetical protein EA428_07355 [Spirochaetaceae bacterium]|nr:MAG: hypothetical protein EA428_07355 [Spirochaetaceae bacterium]
MRVVAINGSPRGAASSSHEVVRIVQSMVPPGVHAQWQTVEHIQRLTEADLELMSTADVLLIAFPLYIDGVPASTLGFLERYKAARMRAACAHGAQRVFAVSNCGFYEGAQNRWAVEIMANYCADLGLRWCGGVGIGTGEMIRGLAQVPLKARVRRPVTAALLRLAEAIQETHGALDQDIYTQHALPWRIYQVLGQHGWRRQLRRNGLHAREIGAQPLTKSFLSLNHSL